MMENGVSLTRDDTMGPGYMGDELECQVESMMVGVSREEEPHHHGGVITLVQGPTTIPENGVEGGLVLGGHTTGGHEREKELEMGIKYCPGVEVTLPRYRYVEHKPHSSKIWPDRVVYDVKEEIHTPPLGPILEPDARTYSGALTPLPGPSVVHTCTEMERFRDVDDMIQEWEEMEGDIQEWEVVGGMRRGGRRVSKRISELLDIFDPEGGARKSIASNLEVGCARDIPEQQKVSSSNIKGRDLKSTIGGYQRNIVTGSTEGASTLISRKVYKLSKTPRTSSNYNEAKLFMCKERDWSTQNDRQELTANRRRAFQKRERESDCYELPVNTKKTRP